MAMNEIDTLEELGRCLNTYVLELENTIEFKENLLEDTIRIINSLFTYEISLFCQPDILSHQVFVKFCLCYCAQLNLWRRGFILSNYGRQALFKVGNLFNALSKHVTDDNVDTFKRILFDKKLIEELCLCLTELIYRIDDPNIECIGHLILSLHRIEDHRRILQNDVPCEQLIDAIIECLASPWYEMCLCAQMTDAQQIVYNACLDYILGCIDMHFGRASNQLFTVLVTAFPQWFFEQANNALILRWNEPIISVISKLLSILTHQIWKYDHRIDEIYIDSYKRLVEALLLIVSKTLVQSDRNENNSKSGLFLQYLTDLALNPYLSTIIRKENLSQVYFYFVPNEQLETQLYAYYLLMATLTTTELAKLIDAKQIIDIVLKVLMESNGTNAVRHRQIIALNLLRQSLGCESMKEEFMEQGGLSQIKKFAMCFEKESFKLRDAAFRVIRVLHSGHTSVSSDEIDTVSEVLVGNEQDWISTVWQLRNWNGDKKEHTSVTFSIPTHNFDPMKAVEAFLKHNKAISDQRLKRAAQRNREDINVVWIYSDEDEILVETITDHLHSIVHTVRVYADVENSEAIKFILHNREERIFVLIHIAIEKTIIRRIQHAAHVAFIVVYGASYPSEKPSTKREDTTLTSYESNLYCAIDLLATNVQTHRNHAFWFFESKQMLSADLSTESAAFLWQLLLTRIKVSSIGMSDLVTLAQQWYRNNPLVLCEIEQFRKEYNCEIAKDWFYTNGSSFIQRMIQQAFKQKDMQVIWAARFFIIDIMKSIRSHHRTDCLVLGELMSAKRIQFLLEHQDTLIMPKGFLMCCTNREKVINDVRTRPRHRGFVHAILFEMDRDDNSLALPLDNSEYVLLPFDISFQIIAIRFDQSLDIYRIQLKTREASDMYKQLWQRHVELSQEAGECVDENILFGSLLADMNRVPAAMSYYFFYLQECLCNPFSNVHQLVAMGRTALRCDNLEDAEKYHIQAIALYETNLTSNDLYFIRLLLDLTLIYIKQEKNDQAIHIYERAQMMLTERDMLSSLTLHYWSQGLGCLCQLKLSNTQPVREMLKAYFDFYRPRGYRCAHPLLIGGLSIDIGDFVYEQGYLDMSSDCYTFAFEISHRNLPLCHDIVIVSLRRLLKTTPLLSTTDKRDLSICETQLLPLLQKLLSDVNDEDNPTIANTMRDIGFAYVKYGMHENAKFYFEKCIPIYRRQYPQDEASLHQCQAYLCKKEQSLDLKIFAADPHIAVLNLQLSASYRYTYPADPIEAKEQQQLWSAAMPRFHYNSTVESKIVRRPLVVWIDTMKEINHGDVLQELSVSSCQVDLHIYDSVDLAIVFLLNKTFEHVRVVLNISAADIFFTKQDTANLQTTACLTMCVFVYGIEHDEELYKKYLRYLQCNRKCWSQLPDIVERCLIMSRDHLLLRRFCLIKDTLGLAIALLMFLVEIEAFGDMFSDRVDPLKHQFILNSSESNVEFVGYMSGCSSSEPKLFQHLRFAKSTHFPKSDAQMAALIMYGRRHGLSSEHIASICRHFCPGCCIKPQTLLKYFVRLWSLESPPFYRLVNQSLAECDIADVHLLRFILYDYFELFNAKLLPYYVGTLYRGIQTSEEEIAALLSLVGEQIYFVCFTSTSKNLARATMGGNVLIEIHTLTQQQQQECRTQTNADISSVSQFPEEEEVIYAPLTKFLLLGVTMIVDEHEGTKYIIKVREQASILLLQLFMDKERLPNGTPFQSGTDMWQYGK